MIFDEDLRGSVSPATRRWNCSGKAYQFLLSSLCFWLHISVLNRADVEGIRWMATIRNHCSTLFRPLQRYKMKQRLIAIQYN